MTFAALGRDRRLSWLLPLTVILIASALLTLPAVFSAMRTNDSFWIDWVWVDQFSEQLRHGVAYPRWLPYSHAGLGSPVFYYYPPLAFYVAAPFSLAGMSVYASILAMFVVGYVLSGLTMYVWLKDRAPAPLLGALVFVAAPYHSFNFYNRGAMAEFLATAIIPLVMLGLRRTAERQSGGILLASVSYGALICTHLPLTLLASLFLFAPYSLLLARRNWPSLTILGATLAGGIALASIYLVPLVALSSYRDTASLWALPTLSPSSWTVWRPSAADFNAMRDILIIAAALALPLGFLALRHRSAWAMFGVLYVALAIGVVPAVWNLPILRSVQFPFRLIPIAEFALATAAARSQAKFTLPLSAIPMAVTLLIATAPPLPPAISPQELTANHPDVPENLPPGPRRYTWPSRWALGVAAAHGRLSVQDGVTTEPVFYFPAWEVRCQGNVVPTFPAPDTQLLSYRGTGCRRTLGITKAERWGAWVSLVALFMIAAASWKGRPGRAGRGPGSR